ncbi:MAG: prolipoprotein diacylglyceryl transferase [Deltaproteobacteria bacterium]|nr:prolipoprotein diacylglyceryl transferase [Deltaproteobacteria bacterium]
MFDEIFLLILAGAVCLLFSWAFRTLPQEEWQILACLPGRKGPRGIWSGVNLTYYGFFNALAYVLAVAMFLIMISSLRIPLTAALSVILPLLAVCMWASRFIARLVEKKPHTFSVGAASFVGIIAAPWIIALANAILGKLWMVHIPFTETLTAMVIAYAFGEGIGRLACISFGCCYGKPLAECSPIHRRIFRRRHFVFWGKTKKITYADELEGRAVIPVQALTAVIYTGTGLVCLYLFLKGWAAAALMLGLALTQTWRFVSEFLRADYRGTGHISAYQIMTLAGMTYALVFAMFNTDPYSIRPDLAHGLLSLWNPALIIFLAVLWIAAFLFTGKSSVTCSSIDIRIVGKNI